MPRRARLAPVVPIGTTRPRAPIQVGGSTNGTWWPPMSVGSSGVRLDDAGADPLDDLKPLAELRQRVEQLVVPPVADMGPLPLFGRGPPCVHQGAGRSHARLCGLRGAGMLVWGSFCLCTSPQSNAERLFAPKKTHQGRTDHVRDLKSARLDEHRTM